MDKRLYNQEVPDNASNESILIIETATTIYGVIENATLLKWANGGILPIIKEEKMCISLLLASLVANTKIKNFFDEWNISIKKMVTALIRTYTIRNSDFRYVSKRIKNYKNKNLVSSHEDERFISNNYYKMVDDALAEPENNYYKTINNDILNYWRKKQKTTKKTLRVITRKSLYLEKNNPFYQKKYNLYLSLFMKFLREQDDDFLVFPEWMISCILSFIGSKIQGYHRCLIREKDIAKYIGFNESWYRKIWKSLRSEYLDSKKRTLIYIWDTLSDKEQNEWKIFVRDMIYNPAANDGVIIGYEEINQSVKEYNDYIGHKNGTDMGKTIEFKQLQKLKR